MHQHSQLKTQNGKRVLIVRYSAELRDWDKRIAEALEAHAVARKQVRVIALPEDGSPERMSTEAMAGEGT